MQATHTFSLIAQEILSRQDPRLFDADVVCRRYPVAGPTNQRVERMAYEPQLDQDCRNIDWRYNKATIAIRQDLETKIAAEDSAIIAQAGTGQP